MFCKHTWVFLKEHTVPSKFEILEKSGTVRRRDATSPAILYKESNAVYACSKCGKFEVVNTNNRQAYD